MLTTVREQRGPATPKGNGSLGLITVSKQMRTAASPARSKMPSMSQDQGPGVKHSSVITHKVSVRQQVPGRARKLSQWILVQIREAPDQVQI